jgi:hypothetical protein
MSPPSWLKDLPLSKASEPNLWPPSNNVDYDWDSTTTDEVYNEPDIAEFASTFEKARNRLDYSYHKKLSLTRQMLQDAIMSRVTNNNNDNSSSDPQNPDNNNNINTRPWIVFTAGAMGVGKGYVTMNLHKAGLFPLETFLKVDPDMLKQEIPEMSGYLNQDKASAATKVHRESTHMADIIFEHALLHNLPLLVDGSLRDVEWYKLLFARIRKEFPQYRIAIVHVTATREKIYERAQSRAEKTGRAVPKEVLDDSIEQVPRSVQILSHQADMVHVIANNEGSLLQVESTIIGDQLRASPMTWVEFSKSWEVFSTTNQKADIIEEPSHIMECNMASVWDDTESHEVAKAIWGKAYPNFCPRCSLSCDGQCGRCIHGRSVCACKECH